MVTAEERLRFAIRFAQMDLDRLRPGDWMNLKDDLMDFLFPGDIADIHGIPADDPRQMTVEDAKTLQRDVKEILDIATSIAEKAAEAAPKAERVPLLAFMQPQLSIKPVFAMFPTHASDRLTVVFNGPARDAILMQLVVSLTHLPFDVLRRCPECGTIFYRVRKQQYCSRPCVHRANVRQWRHTEAGKAYERTRSHTRYEARIQQGTSPNVRVARRPRSTQQQQGG